MPRVPQHLETAGITAQRTNRQPSAHSTQLHAGCAKRAAEQQPPPHAAPPARSGGESNKCRHHTFFDYFQGISKQLSPDFPPVQVAGASLSPPLLCPYSRKKEKER